MNFNPQNRANLESLVAALGSGLDPSVGMSVLNQTIADQQQRVDQRKANLQQWGGQVADMAMSGMPQAQATTMMDLLTPKPGVPNKVQGMLDQAYPAPPTNYLGHVMDMPEGNRPTSQLQNVVGIPYGAQQSPMFLDNPMLNQPPEPVEPGLEQELGGFVKGVVDAVQAGASVQEVWANIMSEPELAGFFAANADKLTPMLQSLFGGPSPLENPLANLPG